MGYRSLTVIGNDTIRKLGYGFLLAFHSNYGPILYHFIDSVIQVENCDVFIPPAFHIRVGGQRQNIAITFGVEKLEWCGYPTVTQYRLTTVGWTDILR